MLSAKMSDQERPPPAEDAGRIRRETGAAMPASRRRALMAEVRRRLESGELDSDLARIETALALLDGDPA